MRHRRAEEQLEPRTKYMDASELHGAVGFLLRAAWKEESRQFTLYFQEYDFTPALYAIMVLVDRNPRCGVTELAKALGINQTNLVHLIDELIERKFLTRTVALRDKRARVLELTREGTAHIAHLRKVHERYEQHGAQRLGKVKRDQLRRILSSYEIYPA